MTKVKSVSWRWLLALAALTMFVLASGAPYAGGGG